MANPTNFDLRGSCLGDMFVQMSYTATGTSAAQTLTEGKGFITSATTSGTGVLTVVLKERWAKYRNFIHTVQQASYSASGACNIVLTAQAATGTTKTLTFLLTNSAGAAVNAASGDIVRITLLMGYVKY